MRDTGFIPFQSSGAFSVHVLNCDQKKDLYIEPNLELETNTYLLCNYCVEIAY